MKRFTFNSALVLIGALLLGPLFVHAACTNTPNLGYCKSAVGDTDVLTQLNANWDKADAPAKLVVSGVGPHAVGVGTNTSVQFRIGGTFNGAASAQGLSIESTLAPAANNDAYALPLTAAINEASSGTHSILAGLYGAVTFTNGTATATDVAQIYAKNFTAPTGTTTASTVKIVGAPTGATNNYALHVTAGTVKNDGRLVQALTNPTYGASVAIDSSLGNIFRITATNGTAFTVANPTNAIVGQQIVVMIRNTSGGALGTVTWDTLYKLATWTSPANANSRSITFVYDSTNWVETSRTTADVPN